MVGRVCARRGLARGPPGPGGCPACVSQLAGQLPRGDTQWQLEGSKAPATTHAVLRCFLVDVACPQIQAARLTDIAAKELDHQRVQDDGADAGELGPGCVAAMAGLALDGRHW